MTSSRRLASSSSLLIRRPSTVSRLISLVCTPFGQVPPFPEVFHQFIYEVRAASRLAYNGIGEHDGRFIVLADQSQSQFPGLGLTSAARVQSRRERTVA